jgi:hypothetical protein
MTENKSTFSTIFDYVETLWVKSGRHLSLSHTGTQERKERRDTQGKDTTAQTSPLGPVCWGDVAYAPTWLRVHITELSNCLDTLARKFKELEWVVIFIICTVSKPMTYDKRFGSILDQCFSFWGEFSSFFVKYFRKGTYCDKFSGFWKTYCQKNYNCLQHERVLKIFLLWYLEYLQIWSNILMNGWHLTTSQNW